MAKGISGHQSVNMKSDEWLTPLEMFTDLGPFDLDPCAPIENHWTPAKKHYTILDNGLRQSWAGRVWLNPPYGTTMYLWMQKMAMHSNGIMLTFARTETVAFQRWVFPYAHGIFFIWGRLTFYNSAGMKSRSNGGAPSVLIAYDPYSAQLLQETQIKGWYINNYPK